MIENLIKQRINKIRNKANNVKYVEQLVEKDPSDPFLKLISAFNLWISESRTVHRLPSTIKWWLIISIHEIKTNYLYLFCSCMPRLTIYTISVHQRQLKHQLQQQRNPKLKMEQLVKFNKPRVRSNKLFKTKLTRFKTGFNK